MCASLPATKKFFSCYWPRLLRSTNLTQSHNSRISNEDPHSSSSREHDRALRRRPSNDSDSVDMDDKCSTTVTTPIEIEFQERKKRMGSQQSNIYVETKISISTDDNTRLGTSSSEQTFGGIDSHNDLVLVPV